MKNKATLIPALGMLFCLNAHAQTASADGSSLTELRDTVIGVLDALVQKGLLSKEQAQQIVAAAQQKAAADAKQKVAEQEAEKGAVRVTHVPENIQADIAKQVASQLRPEVVGDVVSQAKSEGWGVPAALPEWTKTLTLYGDVRMRVENDAYATDNAVGLYQNFDAINTAGGLKKAGLNALLNVSQDRLRTVGRLRFGVTADLGNAFKADVRIVSGTARVPNSTNQTLGGYGGRGSVNVDKAALIWNPISRFVNQEFKLQLGRFDNPYFTTSELMWDTDLTFEGMSATYAFDAWGRTPGKMERGLFVTVGASPIQEVELSSKDKWLYGVQLGTEIPLLNSAVLRAAGASYYFQNIAGKKNAPDSNLLDYTAPKFLSKGNTLFDISNSTTDSSVNLFALASDFRVEDVNVSLDLPVPAKKRLVVSAEYVRNVGFDSQKILQHTGDFVASRNTGYDISLMVGDRTLNHLGAWRTSIAYRKVLRDAVVDAFTDSDFHMGGTDAKGYIYSLEFGLSRATSIKARYLSASEVDGPNLGVDVLQLDLNGWF